jgi:hypothetical protein
MIALSALASVNTASSQSRAGDKVIELKSESCEIDEANFSIVMNAALEKVKDGGSLIAIARLGTGDRANNLNRERLRSTKLWLGRADFPANKLVVAEGERMSGNGRVDFYIGGVLTHVILPKPNGGLCVECCPDNPFEFIRRRKSRN